MQVYLEKENTKFLNIFEANEAQKITIQIWLIAYGVLMQI